MGSAGVVHGSLADVTLEGALKEEPCTTPFARGPSWVEGGFNGQVAMSALGSGPACPPRLSLR